MSSDLSPLTSKSLVLVFAYAPAGLGHLRVSDALYQGLPKGVVPLLLGSQDTNITFLHRLTSIHPWARNIFEWAQSGAPEDVFTNAYRFLLRHQTKLIYQQMITILEERIDVPETVLIVATHFGLAHQLAVIKERLAKEKKVKMVLIAQVTDDSPQHIWYIPGTDMIFTPSEMTKQKLLEYGKNSGLPPVNFKVSAYPVSPYMGTNLSHLGQIERKHAVDFYAKSHIHITIPISGAAVGTAFFSTLIDTLHNKSPRFLFHVVAKTSLYTARFLNNMLERPYVKLNVSANDRGVVDMYEKVYQTQAISLEITKPSEQAFKALLHPGQIGGSILLFSEPIGRQEYDNLDFLRRHHLMPSISAQIHMWEEAKRDNKIREELLEEARKWRGLEIPKNPELAAVFTYWALREGLFAQMIKYRPDDKNREMGELSPKGVHDFWKRVSAYLNGSSDED